MAAAAARVEVPWFTVTDALASFELPPLSHAPTPLMVYAPTTGILNEKAAELVPEATVTIVTALPEQPDPAKNVAPAGVELRVAVPPFDTGGVARFAPWSATRKELRHWLAAIVPKAVVCVTLSLSLKIDLLPLSVNVVCAWELVPVAVR